MYDVQVVLIDAGKITTPIWDKARNHPGYFGPEHGSILAFRDKLIDKQIATSISVQKVDDILIEAVTAKRVRVRYLVMRHKWKFNLIRRLPAAWVDSLIQKNLRKQSGFRPF
jgi:hypothetical protein